MKTLYFFRPWPCMMDGALMVAQTGETWPVDDTDAEVLISQGMAALADESKESKIKTEAKNDTKAKANNRPRRSGSDKRRGKNLSPRRRVA